MQGCLITFAIIVILGLIIQYWPIALAIIAMYLIYKWAVYKSRVKVSQECAPINDEQIILCAGKYRGGQNIPVGIYNLIILSGTGIFQTNKPDALFVRLESNAEEQKKRNWPEQYNGLIITKETILDISESARIKFMLVSKLNSNEQNTGYITPDNTVVSKREIVKEFQSGNNSDITNDCNEADKVIENAQSKINLDTMDGHDFEHFCANVLRKSGYVNVCVTKGSGDQGVDITAERDGIKYAIQCKRYAQPVGNKAVQEIYAGKKFYHCHVGIIMTNNNFTSSARELAKENGIILWDREFLKKFLGEQELKNDFCIDDLEKQNTEDFNHGPAVKKEVLYDECIIEEKSIRIQERKDMYDKEQGVYPSGVYVVGEDLEIGTYLLECEDKVQGYVAYYESYSSFVKNDILSNLTFSEQYHLPLRARGMVVEIENVKTVKKL